MPLFLYHFTFFLEPDFSWRQFVTNLFLSSFNYSQFTQNYIEDKLQIKYIRIDKYI